MKCSSLGLQQLLGGFWLLLAVLLEKASVIKYLVWGLKSRTPAVAEDTAVVSSQPLGGSGRWVWEMQDISIPFTQYFLQIWE